MATLKTKHVKPSCCLPCDYEVNRSRCLPHGGGCVLEAASALRPNSCAEAKFEFPGPCSELGQKTCGEFCIDLTDTCCPSGAGGCPLGTYCSLGDNGEYGCCEVGETCVGDGGVEGSTTIRTSTIIDEFTSTQTIPGETSTITEDIIVTQTSTSIDTDDNTSTSTSSSTLALTSTSALTLTPISSPPVLASSASLRPSSNAITGNPTATSALPEFTGAAEGRAQGISGWLLAAVLPFLLA